MSKNLEGTTMEFIAELLNKHLGTDNRSWNELTESERQSYRNIAVSTIDLAEPVWRKRVGAPEKSVKTKVIREVVDTIEPPNEWWEVERLDNWVRPGTWISFGNFHYSYIAALNVAQEQARADRASYRIVHRKKVEVES